MIRKMRPADSQKVLEIYMMGIETRNATFETAIPSWKDWDQKHLPHSRYISEEEGTITGWAALSAFSAREVYKGVAEISIYVSTAYRNRNFGSQLMEAVIESSEINGIWTLVASVFPENEATLKLHRKFGFREIGRRQRIARLDGIWRDTILLERRSSLFI
jgi:L-amino acid N-acyltransferase YncA